MSDRPKRPVAITVRVLGAPDIELVRLIDRSEHVDVAYEVVDGRLRERNAPVAEIPPWESTGDGAHSFEDKIGFCRESVRNGGQLLGGYAGEQFAGLAVVEPSFEPPLARLSFLHVSRPTAAAAWLRRCGRMRWSWGVPPRRHACTSPRPRPGRR